MYRFPLWPIGFYVYELVNLPSGRRYVGSTCDPTRRMVEHYYRFEGVREHIKDWDYNILAVAQDRQEMLALEYHWIGQLNSADSQYGYNRIGPRPVPIVSLDSRQSVPSPARRRFSRFVP